MVSIRLTGSGDVALQGLLTALGKIGRGKFARALTRKLAPQVEALSDVPWQRRADPYGVPWAPRKRRYPHPLLEKSREMRHSVRSRVDGLTVVTSTEATYAGLHQRGTRKMPSRAIFPDSRGLPRPWELRLQRTALDMIRKVLRG